MTDFDRKLQEAIQRGKHKSDEAARKAAEAAMSEEEIKRLHSQYRLQLSEHIEECVRQLPHHFPGFQIETLYGDKGWGAACSRDDIRLDSGARENIYSRLEMTVRPFSSYQVVDLAAKGMVHNRELLSRNHFEKITEVDPQRFLDLIDRWILEYAELYSARA